MRRHLIALALVASVSTSGAAAPPRGGLEDAVLRILPDTRIAFRTSAGQWGTGRFVTNRGDSLYFRTDSEQRALWYREITSLATRQNARVGGIGTGMMVGSVTAGLVGSTSSLSEGVGLALAGTVVGGFFGGLIGSALQSWKPVFAEGDAAQPAAAGFGGPRRPTAIGFKLGYVTSEHPSDSNQGASAALTILPGVIGIEAGFFPRPSNEVPPPPGSYGPAVYGSRGSGHTIELHAATRVTRGRGLVRPTLTVGAGPSLDREKFVEYTTDGSGNIIDDREDWVSDWRLGFHVSPGVRIGSGPWGTTIEGTYHGMSGRGSYSSFVGVLAGVGFH